MKINFKKSKFKIIILTVVALVVIFTLIVPRPANALFAANIANWIFSKLAWFVLTLFGFVLRIAVGFFNIMLGIDFADNRAVTELGWGIVRNFANMFFILVMVIIAFSTILRIERYGIKKLLPKVIIVALLINFSLVLCYVVIDFTDITAHYFIDNAKTSITGENTSIGSVFVNGLNLAKTVTPGDCDTTYTNAMNGCSLKSSDEKQDCEVDALQDREACKKGLSTSQGFFSDVGNGIVSMLLGSFVMMVAAFTFFAGGILLLIRMLFLWFLVMLVPIVLLCMLLPGLGGQWEKWLKSFLNWALFAPIYCFFIWLAVKILQESRLPRFGDTSGGTPQLNSAFFSTGNNLLQFLYIIALLLGGLIAAKQIGLYGAAAIYGVGKKWAGGARDWAKRTTTRPLVVARDKARAGAFAAGGKLFGDTKLGRRMRARADQFKRAPEERPEHKKYDAMLNTMGKEDLLKEVETAKGVRKFIAARKAQSKGWLRDAKTSQVQAATDTMKAFGATEVAKQIEESRLDSIRNNTEQETTVQKVVQEGNLNKIPAIALEDERLVAAISKFASAVQIESLRNASPQHKDKLEDKLEKITNPANAATMASLGINPALDEIQHAYASQTGDTTRMKPAQQTNWAKKAGPDGLKRLSLFTPSSIGTIAENIPTSQLKNALEKMTNAAAVKAIVAYLKSTPTAAGYDLATNDEWLKNL